MDRAHRVAAASIMHESNSFSKEPTHISDFTFRRGFDRDSTLSAWAANRNEVAGFLDGAAEAGFAILPIVYAVATPSGPVSAETFEELAGGLIQGIIHNMNTADMEMAPVLAGLLMLVQAVLVLLYLLVTDRLRPSANSRRSASP